MFKAPFTKHKITQYYTQSFIINDLTLIVTQTSFRMHGLSD